MLLIFLQLPNIVVNNYNIRPFHKIMGNNQRFLQAIYNQPLLITDSEIGLLQASIQLALTNPAANEIADEKTQAQQRIGVEIYSATASGNKRRKMYMGAGTYLYGDNKEENGDDDIENGIAIVSIKGMIMDASYSWYSSTSPRQLIEVLRALGDDPRVLGIMLNVDSGGGAVTGVLEASDLIRNYYRIYGKRVQASVERAGSAAYWLISGADKILLTNATASAGSIGTMTTFTNATKALESFGIVSTNIYATLSTLKNKDYEDALKGQYDGIINDMLDPINTEFIRSVSKGRYGSKYSPEAMLAGTEEAPDFLRGKMYYGSAAKDAGLVDGIATMGVALNNFYNVAISGAPEPISPIDNPAPQIVYPSQQASQQATSIQPLKRMGDIFKTN